MREILFDMETDGLYDEVTKIHVISYCYVDKPEEVFSIYTKEEIVKLFNTPDVKFVGHNVLNYDFPVLNKLLGIKSNYKRIIDTLYLSYYLHPYKIKHGLAELGNKVEVEDEEWKVGDRVLMTERCEGDVRDNIEVYNELKSTLKELYGKETDGIINYLMFKTDCLRVQEFEGGITLDVGRINKALDKLQPIHQGKIDTLASVLPEVPVYGIKTPPKTKLKKDGTESKRYLDWIDFLRENDIEEDFEGEVQFIRKYNSPNPNSHNQIKDWLFTLGWVPEHFNYVREEDGSFRKIPQIKSKDIPGEVCQSIKKLSDKAPDGIEALDSISILKHRIDILLSLLKNNKGGKIYPTSLGFTKTLRKRHRVLVNLPSVHSLHSEDIRTSLIAKEGNVLIGSDLAGIEDATKQHYIYHLDEEYVKEQMRDGFDSHMDIAKLAGLIDEKEVELWKNLKKLSADKKLSESGIKELDRLEGARDYGKLVNFSALYKIGAATMNRNTGMPKKQCENFLKIYWTRNWAVREFEKEIESKTLKSGKTYVKNPINGYWYFLEFEKDKFSAVNQSSGQYILDLYILLVRIKYKVLFQYHDELLIEVPKEEEEEAKTYLKACIDKINATLKLNVKVRASYLGGKNYGEV